MENDNRSEDNKGNGRKRKASSSETDPSKTLRRQKRAKISNCGVADRSRGVTRVIYGNLQWYDAVNNIYIDAVYHNDIRQQLQQTTSQNYTLAYTNEREAGADATDITAFHPGQRQWGQSRTLWPLITGNVLNRIHRNNFSGPYDDQQIDLWFWNRMIVLDHDGHPMRRLQSLPVTLSSATTGWLYEALQRLDKRITRQDIWGRLPSTYIKHGQRRGIYGPSEIGNIINRDFLYNEGIPSWKAKSNDDAKQQWLLQRIARRSPGDLAANYVTNGASLNDEERKHFNKIGRGQHLEKSKYRDERQGCFVRRSIARDASNPNSGSVLTLPNSNADPSPSSQTHASHRFTYQGDAAYTNPLSGYPNANSYNPSHTNPPQLPNMAIVNSSLANTGNIAVDPTRSWQLPDPVRDALRHKQFHHYGNNEFLSEHPQDPSISGAAHGGSRNDFYMPESHPWSNAFSGDWDVLPGGEGNPFQSPSVEDLSEDQRIPALSEVQDTCVAEPRRSHTSEQTQQPVSALARRKRPRDLTDGEVPEETPSKPSKRSCTVTPASLDVASAAQNVPQIGAVSNPSPPETSSSTIKGGRNSSSERGRSDTDPSSPPTMSEDSSSAGNVQSPQHHEHFMLRRPQNHREAAIIGHALNFTLMDMNMRLHLQGLPAIYPRTNPDQSYVDQFLTVDMAYNHYWHENVQDVEVQPPPLLKVRSWSGTWDNYELEQG